MDKFTILIKRNSLFLSILFCLLFISSFVEAKQIPAQSNPPKLVNDYAGVLSPGERQALERKLVAYDDSTSTQIAIVIERSLEGDDAFDYSLRIAESWGIGRKGKDNGVLFYIAVDDRKLYIQNGYGVEGYFTDGLARRVIENILKPAFKKNQYYQGLDQATSIVIDAGAGEYTNDSGPRDAQGGIPAILVIVAILIILIIISSMNQNDDDDGGYYRGGRYDMDNYPQQRRRRRGGGGGWIIFPGMGGGGGGGWDGGGGGFGGGGFGGFGGGGFGGGGAGGSW